MEKIGKLLKIEIWVAAALMAVLTACGDDVKDPDNGGTHRPSDEMSLEAMSIEDKVAQMFIVHPERLSNTPTCTKVNDVMKENLYDYPVGGVILFGANIVNPDQLRQLVSDIKASCKYPPFIAIDEEGGLVARIANNKNFNVEKFPGMLEIGNTGNTDNAYHVGDVIGEYLSKYGINLNFAPVADVFSNPANTVIGNRSFGTTEGIVSPMVSACIDGLHSHGILTTIKHFPGHGDTGSDSHTSLPLVTKTWDELMGCEIVPFRDNFGKTDMIMTAHIAVSDVNEQENGNTVPSTLSHNMLTGKLRNELGYKGVIITDAMGMGGITQFCPTQGEAAIKAILAGADIILCPADFININGCYYAVLAAVKDGTISEKRIDESVARIIALKKKMLK